MSLRCAGAAGQRRLEGFPRRIAEQVGQWSALPPAVANTLKQANETNEMHVNIDTMERMNGITGQMAETMHSMVAEMKDMKIDVAEFAGQHPPIFDDFFRPIRNYFYWETALLQHPGLPLTAIGGRHPRRHRRDDRRHPGPQS